MHKKNQLHSKFVNQQVEHVHASKKVANTTLANIKARVTCQKKKDSKKN
jgi:hypothetical protein